MSAGSYKLKAVFAISVKLSMRPMSVSNGEWHFQPTLAAFNARRSKGQIDSFSGAENLSQVAFLENCSNVRYCRAAKGMQILLNFYVSFLKGENNISVSFIRILL